MGLHYSRLHVYIQFSYTLISFNLYWCNTSAPPSLANTANNDNTETREIHSRSVMGKDNTHLSCNNYLTDQPLDRKKLIAKYF